jgi:hypothetical protein
MEERNRKDEFRALFRELSILVATDLLDGLIQPTEDIFIYLSSFSVLS